MQSYLSAHWIRKLSRNPAAKKPCRPTTPQLCVRRLLRIHPELELRSKNAHSRRALIELLHLAEFVRTSGTYDGEWALRHAVRIPPDNLHTASFPDDFRCKASQQRSLKHPQFQTKGRRLKMALPAARGFWAPRAVKLPLRSSNVSALGLSLDRPSSRIFMHSA